VRFGSIICTYGEHGQINRQGLNILIHPLTDDEVEA
jgi:aromatic ring-cleaving dioxygenase